MAESDYFIEAIEALADRELLRGLIAGALLFMVGEIVARASAVAPIQAGEETNGPSWNWDRMNLV